VVEKALTTQIHELAAKIYQVNISEAIQLHITRTGFSWDVKRPF